MSRFTCFSTVIVLSFLTSVSNVHSENYLKRRETAEKYLSTLSRNSEEWRDPNDMLIGGIGVNSRKQNEETDFKSIRKDSSINIYLRRWLYNLISKLAGNSWYNTKTNFIGLSVPGELKDILEKAIHGDYLNLHGNYLAKLDEDIMDIIASATVNHPRNNFSFSDFSVFGIHFDMGQLLLFCVIVFIFVWAFVMYYPKTSITFVIFIISVFWNWLKLYQKAIAEKHYYLLSLNHPSECRKSELGFFDSLLLYFKSFWTGSADCKKYYEALLVDPVWEVNLSVAISDTISNTFFHIFKVGAQTLNFCVKEIFSGLALYQIVFVFMIIFCLFLFAFNYRIAVLSCLFVIEPTYRYNERIQDGPVRLRSIGFWSKVKELVGAIGRSLLFCNTIGHTNAEINQKKQVMINSHDKDHRSPNLEIVSNQFIFEKAKKKQQEKFQSFKRSLSSPALLHK